MTRTIKIIVYTGIICLLSACSEDFLERDNPEIVSIDNFYKTENDFQMAVAGVYNVLVRADYYNGYLYRYLEIASDDANPGDDALYNSIIGNDITSFNLPSDNYTSLNIFAVSYIGIARANTTMNRALSSGLSNSFVSQIEAECRFLRALYYFNLVRLFGDVPLILKEITDPQEARVPRTDLMKIYIDAIIPDLEYAIAMLPTVRDNENIARATSWAAKGLLAKVYLTLGEKESSYYQKSRDVSFEIINNGPFELEEIYADLFKRENEFGKESIFEINYISGQHFYDLEGFGVGVYVPQRNGVGSYFNNFYMPRFRGRSYLGEQNGAFAEGGYGIGVPTTSLDPRGSNYSVPVGTGIVEKFLAADTRKPVTILDYYNVAGELGLPVDNQISPFNVNKYNDFEDNDNGEADDNYYLLRLADIYLMFAEAENEINNGPNAIAYEFINKVRRRAFSQPIHEASEKDLTGLDYQEFLNAVYAERRLELAFEGQRWFDLIRRPERAVATMIAHGKNQVTIQRLLLPIPQYVIDETEGLITQNTGYN